jgi:dihydroorotate dehydrogenase electron transfer subunit
MNPRQINATIIDNEQLSPDTYRITLNAPEVTESAMPGQFVMIKASDESGSPLIRRPLSIHQASADGSLQILFKKLGQGTSFLARRKKGEMLNVLGPLGKGFSIPANPAPICIIGGGIGVAPLFYLTQKIIQLAADIQEIKVLLGATTASELTPIEREFRDLGVEVHVSTDNGSAGHHGLVTDLLSSKLSAETKWNVLSCGPYPMLKGVVELCKTKKYPCQVSMETMMACGISACLGCAVRSSAQSTNKVEPYLHVCKDGPVFQANELEWL